MKVGFFGDGPWSHKAFNLLIEDKNFDVVFVCVRNDPGDEHLIKLAKKENIEVLQNENINSPHFISKLKLYDSDIFVSLAFNQIFKKDAIQLPLRGVINCHAGKLPRYRGRNILNWALINDEREFGITVHFVDEGIDTGDIIFQKTFSISDEDNYKSLLHKAHEECGPIVLESLRKIQSNNFTRIKQKDTGIEPFYCVGRKPGDEKINWHQSSRDIFNFIRAVSDPGPNARSFISGHEIQIISAKFCANRPTYSGVCGSVVGLEDDGIIIKTKDTDIKITDYIFDKKLKIGDRFE